LEHDMVSALRMLDIAQVVTQSLYGAVTQQKDMVSVREQSNS